MKVKFTLKSKYAESQYKMKVGDYVVLDLVTFYENIDNKIIKNYTTFTKYNS